MEEPMPAKKTGRPSVKDEALEKVKEGFLLDFTIEQACFHAGIDPSTYYKWKQADPQFFEKFELFREDTKMKAKMTVHKHVQRDPRLAIDYLSRVEKANYSTRSEVTGKDGEALMPKPILGGTTSEGVDAES